MKQPDAAQGARQALGYRGVDALELTLSFEGGRWRAAGEGVDLTHAALADLDELILRTLRTLRRSSCAQHVHVRFDTSRLPVWLRQYQPHYFNYVLTVGEEQGADDD